MTDGIRAVRKKKMNRHPWPLVLLLFVGSAGWSQDSADVTHLLDPAGDRVPLQTVVPVYPQRALKERVQGDVEVCFNVDREGRTSRIAVRNSSHSVFEKPAINAVRASSYLPLEDHEILSGIKTCRTFRFRLDPVAIEDPGDASAGVES
jgi:TonB family protein